jgi:nitrogen fixation NifU-like protein
MGNMKMLERKEKKNKKQDEIYDFASRTQKTLLEDMRKIYSPQVIERFLNPRNIGAIENPDGFARYIGPCGDTMEIFLRAKNNRIEQMKFITDGCGSSVVCGSMVTELAEGKTIPEARKITNKKVLKELGGLPEEEQHCALLAATTLHMALNDYLEKKKESWKKVYRVRGR